MRFFRAHVISRLAQHAARLAVWGRLCAPSRLFYVPWAHCNARLPSKVAAGSQVAVSEKYCLVSGVVCVE